MVSRGKKTPAPEEHSAKSEFIRRFKANPFIFIGTIVILVIVVIAFVLVPAIVPNAEMGQAPDLTFGFYNKVPINYVPGGYFAQVQETLARYQQSSINDSNYQLMSYQIWRAAFEETVVHTGILQEMEAAGYTPPAEVVDREVAGLPMFQENGRFSAARYQELDNNTRLTLWRQVRESIAEEYYKADITGLLKPAREGAFISRMASPQRTFDMTFFPIENYPDAEVISYAGENSGLFQVTHFSKITVNSSEREARQILDSIKAGTTTFEDAAKTHSQDSYAEKGGDMGIKLAYELTAEAPAPEDREKLLALGKGEYSDLIKLDAGWAFFRVEDIPYPADTGDSATLEKIRSYIREFERGRMEDWAITEAEEFIAQAAESGFEGAVIEQSLEKRQFGPIPVNYGGIDLFTTLASFQVGEISGAVSDENFWRTAFSTPLNTLSSPLVLGNNVLVLFPLEESDADESASGNIESLLSSYWLSYNAEQAVRSFFLNNEKLEDRFFEIFLRYFWSQE
ncbi:MAG: peptidylprolyl isomerase [Treponema sp.]|nr:peptidylprolyl isomerase [Treponema sp.]